MADQGSSTPATRPASVVGDASEGEAPDVIDVEMSRINRIRFRGVIDEQDRAELKLAADNLVASLRSTRAALEEAKARKPLKTQTLRVERRVWGPGDDYLVIPEIQIFNAVRGAEVTVEIYAAPEK